jgi:hypothetical protein
MVVTSALQPHFEQHPSPPKQGIAPPELNATDARHAIIMLNLDMPVSGRRAV